MSEMGYWVGASQVHLARMIGLMGYWVGAPSPFGQNDWVHGLVGQ